MQLQGAGRAGVLTIAEANARLADFEQNKLQVMLFMSANELLGRV